MVLSYLKAVFDLIGDIAWPATISLAIYWFREPLGQILAAIPLLFDRMKRVKIANIEAELSQQSAAASISEEGKKGIPPNQIEAAIRVKADAVEVGLETIKAQVFNLASEYETIRQNLPSSPVRTARMNQTMAKMRTIALAAEPLLPELVGNKDSEGCRLMAVAILQIKPRPDHIDWLVERFSVEKPFVFYHASLALQRTVRQFAISHSEQLKTAIETAIETLQRFSGEPDRNTMAVLQWSVEELQDLSKHTAHYN